MAQVLETLVQRFLNVDCYNNDIRYVKYCITYVSLTGCSSDCGFCFCFFFLAQKDFVFSFGFF